MKKRIITLPVFLARMIGAGVAFFCPFRTLFCSLWHSFISPCGHISRLVFWWRQGVLALIIFVGTLLYHMGDRLHYGRLFFQSTLESVWVIHSACVTNVMGGLSGYEMAEYLTKPLLCEPVLPVPSDACAMAMLVLGALLLIAASWCSLSLILRRLRDTRLGLGWLPVYLLWCSLICVPSLSERLNQYVDMSEDQRVVLGFFLFAFLHIIYCLPSHKDREEASEAAFPH